MKYLLSILLLLVSVNAYGTELSVDRLFRDQEFKQFRVSPMGHYVSIWRFFEEQDEIIISVPSKEKNITVFKIDESDKSGVVWTGWIDSSSLVVKFYDFFSLPHYMVIDIWEGEDGSVQIANTDVMVPGAIIDTMPETEDTVMFSTHLAKKGWTTGVYKVDLREIDKDYSFSGRLNERMKNGDDFSTDRSHRLRLAKERVKDTIFYKYLDLADERWKTYHSVTRKDADDEDEKGGGEKDKDREIFVPIGFIDDDTIAVASNIGRDTVAIFEFQLANQKFGELLYASDRYDVLAAELNDRTGKLMMVQITENGRTQFKYFTPTEKEMTAKLEKTFPGKKIYLHSSSTDGVKTLVHVLSEDNPGTYYLLDFETASARILADVNPELEGVSLQISNTIRVVSRDGLEIEGLVTLPRGAEEKVPLVVMPHGGPIGVRDWDFYDPAVQFLVDRGFAVLRVNFRGSSGFGKKFKEKGVGQWGKGLEDDIDLSLEHVLSNFPIDTSRVCIMGASYGGYSALMSVIRSPQKYRCAVSRFGVSDLGLILNQTNTREIKEIRKGWENVMGDADDPDFKPREVSPFYLAEKVTVPVMLTAGWKDRRADPEHTHRMRVAMEVLGKPYEYLLYRESEHGHPEATSDQHEMLMIERFLRKSMDIPFPTSDKAVEIRDREKVIIDKGFESGEIEYVRFYPKKKKATETPARPEEAPPAQSETPEETVTETPATTEAAATPN